MFDEHQTYEGFLSPGTRLSKYEIVRGLAVGGMAELYLARTTGMQGFRRMVALKRILPHHAASPEFASMFIDEARLVARLEHPNIAQVFDIGRDPLGLFFTMEYVHGPDVRSILKNAQKCDERVPFGHAVAIVAGAARGLHAAHEKRDRDGRPLGIVHRDVSPSNVLVSFNGIVKLIDFGVAKARLRKHKTRDGTIKGKVSYMSPEQARGEELDCRSDIFSLGILLWELTTTRKLYYGNNDFAILRQIVHKNVLRPSCVVPGYPPALEAIVMRALSRNLGKRYQSARELADELDELAATLDQGNSPAELGAYVSAAFPGALAAGQELSEWCESVPSDAMAARVELASGAERDGDEPADERGDELADELGNELGSELAGDGLAGAEPGRAGKADEDGEQAGLVDEVAAARQARMRQRASFDEPVPSGEIEVSSARLAQRSMRRWLAGLAVAAALVLAGLGQVTMTSSRSVPAARVPVLPVVHSVDEASFTATDADLASTPIPPPAVSENDGGIATPEATVKTESETEAETAVAPAPDTPDTRAVPGKSDQPDNKRRARKRKHRRRGSTGASATSRHERPAERQPRWDPDSALPPPARTARTP